MKIYVGNLSYEVGDEDLRAFFAPFGEILSANVIKDQYSGRSRGFGFVEMPNDAEAQAAIAGLNSKDLKGRTVTVNQARPREAVGGRTGGGGGRSGFGGGGGRGGYSGGGRGRDGGDRGRY